MAIQHDWRVEDFFLQYSMRKISLPSNFFPKKRSFLQELSRRVPNSQDDLEVEKSALDSSSNWFILLPFQFHE